MNLKKIFGIFTIALFVFIIANAAFGIEEDTRNVLKQGLLGAGTGAIASGVSGGNAGTGALIGAGTNVIGGALLDVITAPSASSANRGSSRGNRRSPAPQAQHYDNEENYDDGQEYYEEPPQESGASKVIKQGLLGAGTGALASGMSGGSAGKGALIGAGTNVIGGALLDMMTQPSPQPRRVYRKPPAKQQPQPSARIAQPGDDTGVPGTSQKKIIRKYDDNGKVVSEEEIYY